jgi:signal transduction histidine kinase/DNA-binding NarL/FixJ family response regulator
MVSWLKETCFTNLELDVQKNRLLFFLLCGPIFIMAELNIATHYSLFNSINGQFLLIILVFFGIMLSLLFVPSVEKNYKYVFMTGMLLFSMYQLWAFNDNSLIFQIMYINLALALVYLNGQLIIYTGMTTAIFTALGFIFRKDLFFPQMDGAAVNGSIVIVLQTTVVLWGVTKIGNRFHQFIDHNKQMSKLLRDNENQMLLIHEQNRALTEYSKQVEQLTIVEERNRISRELHDTIGHTLTSMIAGLELTKREMDLYLQGTEKQTERLDKLLDFARRGLEDIRDHVHNADNFCLQESLIDRISQLGSELSINTGIEVEYHTEGVVYPLSQAQHLALLRCVQEALTNAVRHARANRIQIELRYLADKIHLEVKDNGVGATKEKLQQGFGIQTMKERISAALGTVEITSDFGGGVRVKCEIPVKKRGNTTNIRLLLAEDQELIAESFRILLDMELDLQVIGVAGNGLALIEMCEIEAPDVILMDIHMPEMNGIKATSIIKQRWPDVKVIILTTFQDTDNAAEAISLGAEGYLLKSVQPKHLAEAVRIVNSGGSLISMETAKLLVDTRQEHTPTLQDAREEPEENIPVYGLTEKEMEIVRFLSDGLKYKEIALKMHFSESTIKNYVSIIYSKLNVENRMQAINKLHNLL